MLGTGVTQARKDPGLYEHSTGFDAEGRDITFAYISANLTIPRSDLDMAVIIPENNEWRETPRHEVL